MSEDATIFDPSRPELTRHEYLSTNPTLPAPLALVSAPQTTLVVTTLTDMVDATDGVLSLREAITLANETPGLDGITFADNLRGGTLELTGGPLLITEDLHVDGDPANGGPGGILIQAVGTTLDDKPRAFEVAEGGISARFEDISIAGFAYGGIKGSGADIEAVRIDIRGITGIGPGAAIDVRGGTLALEDSVIGYSRGPNVPIGIYLADGAYVLVERSTIAGLAGEAGYGIQGEGRVRVTDTTIADNGLTFGFGISIEGDLLIESSTFARNGTVDGIAGGAVRIDGSLVIVNSTIADTATGATYRPTRTGAVTVLDGSNASIVNSTITGSALGFTDGSPAARNTYGPGTGIYAAPTSVVEVRSSIIDDSVFGTITSNGANTFRELQVAGATGDDRLGVSAEEIFALTKAVPPSFGPGVEFIAGVLADNGGPTQTVALLVDPANPALDAADPAAAPPTDQRGLSRDATPDIGAFENQEPVPPPPDFDRGLLVTSLADDVARDGVVSLREAILTAEENLGPDTITFAATLDSGTIILREGPLRITDELRIDAGMLDQLVVDGDDRGGVFDIRRADVALNGFAIRGAAIGDPTDPLARGGAIRAIDSQISIEVMEIAGNVGRDAGAIFARNSDVAILNSSIEGNSGAEGAISISDGALTLVDSTLVANRAVADVASGGGLYANRANVVIEASQIIDNVGNGVFVRDGSLGIVESEISGSSVKGIIAEGSTDTSIARSLVKDNGATGVFAIGDLFVDQSEVSGNGFGAGFASYFGGGIDSRADLTVINSLIAGNLNRGGPAGINAAGSAGTRLDIVNTTIADNNTESVEAISTYAAGGMRVAFGIEGAVVNSTITGNLGARLGSTPIQMRETAGGIEVGFGSRIELVNTIIVGNEVVRGTRGAADVVGNVESLGSNLIGQPVFSGAVESDLTGVLATNVFVATKLLPNGTAAGVLADNGGPMLTVALLDDDANPAVDAADPRFAPVFDQRGFVRDAAPDIGALELGAGPLAPPPPLPPLVERVPLADADILGAPGGFLTLVGGDAAISFVDEFAAFQNSLGVYLVGADGTIENPQWVFERVEHAESSDLASELARPGGGPLSPGDVVLLSDLFDPAELLPGTTFGLFLAADAWSLNPAAVFEGGTLEFRADGGPASLFDPIPALFHVSESGVERLVAGDIMHTLDPSFFEPLANPLNPGGGAQVTSGTLDGLFTVAFEDKPLAESDRDFNDAIFAIDLIDAGDDLFAVAAAAGAGAGTMPAGGADLEALLVVAEAV